MRLRFSALFILAFVIVIEPAFAQAQFPFTGRVKSDRVYVRAGQNVNFETVAVVNQNDTLVVLAQQYGWLKVKLPAQTKAYVKAEYVDLLSADVAEIRADRVNVRCAANTNATILGKLQKGDRFFIWGKEGDWLAIKPLDQLVGWVKEGLLEPKPGIPVATTLYPPPPRVLKSAAVSAVIPGQPVEPKIDASGSLEATGILKKDGGVFQLYKDNALLYTLEGPGEYLESFVGSTVKVRGTLKNKAVGSSAAPVLSLSKISLVL